MFSVYFTSWASRSRMCRNRDTRLAAQDLPGQWRNSFIGLRLVRFT